MLRLSNENANSRILFADSQESRSKRGIRQVEVNQLLSYLSSQNVMLTNKRVETPSPCGNNFHRWILRYN
jgi:hypothetical protein